MSVLGKHSVLKIVRRALGKIDEIDSSSFEEVYPPPQKALNLMV